MGIRNVCMFWCSSDSSVYVCLPNVKMCTKQLTKIIIRRIIISTASVEYEEILLNVETWPKMIYNAMASEWDLICSRLDSIFATSNH